MIISYLKCIKLKLDMNCRVRPRSIYYYIWNTHLVYRKIWNKEHFLKVIWTLYCYEISSLYRPVSCCKSWGPYDKYVFDIAWQKLEFCLVFLPWISKFKLYWSVFMIMKHNNENTYWDCKLWIFSFLNKSWHESLFLEPAIILTTIFAT